MLTNDWVFNSRSMGTSRDFNNKGILLIGDSIVLGGNPYRQEQRLASQIENLTKNDVWPISAGSWALQNELAYLRKNIDVARGAEQIAIVLNSDDFGDPSYWQSDLTHPRSHPWSDAAFILSKYVFKGAFDKSNISQNVNKRDNDSDFQSLSEEIDKQIYVFLYPTKSEMLTSNPCGFAPKWLLEKYVNNISCISDSSDWKSDLYSDSIHPSTHGTMVLARIISEQLGIYAVRDWKG